MNLSMEVKGTMADFAARAFSHEKLGTLAMQLGVNPNGFGQSWSKRKKALHIFNMMSYHLSPAKKAWITRKILDGKSKYQISKELNICYQTILRIAKDMPNHSQGRNEIRGGTLRMLQYLLNYWSIWTWTTIRQ